MPWSWPRPVIRIAPSVTELRPWAAEMAVCPQQDNGDDCGVYVAIAMIWYGMHWNPVGNLPMQDWSIHNDNTDNARLMLGAVLLSLTLDHQELDALMADPLNKGKARFPAIGPAPATIDAPAAAAPKARLPRITRSTAGAGPSNPAGPSKRQVCICCSSALSPSLLYFDR